MRAPRYPTYVNKRELVEKGTLEAKHTLTRATRTAVPPVDLLSLPCERGASRQPTLPMSAEPRSQKRSVGRSRSHRKAAPPSAAATRPLRNNDSPAGASTHIQSLLPLLIQEVPVSFPARRL